MIIKKRTEPLELQLLKSNRARKKLPEKIENQIITLEKGFIGETMFDQRMESLSLDSLTINDLLLETNSTHYQIDSLFISPPKIHIFEVKNFEGDYIVKHASSFFLRACTAKLFLQYTLTLFSFEHMHL
nr:nuclease-related domain-containing protein [Fredinandcohnia onubensis]